MIKNDILKIFYLGIFFRTIVIISLLLFPIYHEIFGYIQPFKYYEKGDLYLYNELSKYNFSNLIQFISQLFYASFTTLDPSQKVPGFILIIIFKIIEYSNDNYFLFCLLVLLLEVISFYIWLIIFNKFFDKIFLVLFTFIPFSYIYFIFPSIDSFVYFFFTIIIYCIINLLISNQKNELRLFIILFLFLFLKAESLLILLPILIIYFFKREKFNLKMIYSYGYVLLFVIGIIYYYPYYLHEYNTVITRNNNSLDFTNFFLDPSTEIINYINFYIIKFLKIFGFINVSYSNNLLIISVRHFMSFFYIFGFFFSLIFYKNNKLFSFIIFMNTIVILFFLFPSIRYIINYTPLYLFFIFIFLKKKLLKIL
tara:strand:- start:2388 stop:3488 length:1101 start_codon:yes stop_codon:yes gene_type:complete